MKHYLLHLFRWNFGRVITLTLDDGTILVGFMCNKCGHIDGIHKAELERNHEMQDV